MPKCEEKYRIKLVKPWRFLAATLVLGLLAPALGQAPSRPLGSTVSEALRLAKSSTARFVIGYSVEHRPIMAERLGDPASQRSLLVIGSIAGDEPGGLAVVDALESLTQTFRTTLWVIPDMNPDGIAKGMRVNADGVDLNRNFPFAWRPIASRGSENYPGPRPLSEPESRSVAAFIRRIRPTLGIWLHQPFALVDDSQGPLWAEQQVGRDMGLPLARLEDYPGSAIGWEDRLIAHSAFDIELPGGALSRASIARYVSAIMHLARSLAGK